MVLFIKFDMIREQVGITKTIYIKDKTKSKGV